MSAVEFVPTPQMVSALSLATFEEPRTEAGPTRYDGLAQFSLSVASRRMKLLIELGGFDASDETFETFLTQLAPKLRRLMTSDLILFGLWSSEDEQFQVKVFDTNGDFALSPLANYSWPGNVRELQNFIERAVLLSPGSCLHAPLEELKEKDEQESLQNLSTLEEIERDRVLRALRESNWVRGGPNGAAVRLGMKRTTLAYRIRKLKIPCRPE